MLKPWSGGPPGPEEWFSHFCLCICWLVACSVSVLRRAGRWKTRQKVRSSPEEEAHSVSAPWSKLREGARDLVSKVAGARRRLSMLDPAGLVSLLTMAILLVQGFERWQQSWPEVLALGEGVKSKLLILRGRPGSHSTVYGSGGLSGQGLWVLGG